MNAAMKNKMSLVLLGLLSITVSVSAYGSKAFCSNPFSGVREAESLSQLIRSNTAHYWSHVAELPAKAPLRAYQKYQGIVVGDPHMGNFSVVPVQSKAGRRSMKFVDIDLDDAGRGPFAFDFARLVVAVKAVNKDISIKDMLEAYVDGLGGTKSEAPDLIQDALDMTISKFDELEAEYVDKKTTGDKFKIKAGEVESYSAKYSKSSIKALFPTEQVLDIATRPQEGGGSAGAVRIWVLVKGKDGSNRIDEIKGYKPSAMLKLQTQKEPQALVADAQAVLLRGLDPSQYRLVKLDKDFVWLRTKKLPMIDIPYSQKSADAITFVEELSLYDANYLGQLHSGQAQSAAYLKAIEKDRDAFREAVKAVSKAYLEQAEARFEN